MGCVLRGVFHGMFGPEQSAQGRGQVPAWGSEVLEGGPAHLPQALRKAKTRISLLSCSVWDPHVEPSCVPHCPAPTLLSPAIPWTNCPSPSQARGYSGLTSLPGLDKQSFLCLWPQGLGQTRSCDPGQPMRPSFGTHRDNSEGKALLPVGC